MNVFSLGVCQCSFFWGACAKPDFSVISILLQFYKEMWLVFFVVEGLIDQQETNNKSKRRGLGAEIFFKVWWGMGGWVLAEHPLSCT